MKILGSKQKSQTVSLTNRAQNMEISSSEDKVEEMKNPGRQIGYTISRKLNSLLLNVERMIMNFRSSCFFLSSVRIVGILHSTSSMWFWVLSRNLCVC